MKHLVLTHHGAGQAPKVRPTYHTSMNQSWGAIPSMLDLPKIRFTIRVGRAARLAPFSRSHPAPNPPPTYHHPFARQPLPVPRSAGVRALHRASTAPRPSLRASTSASAAPDSAGPAPAIRRDYRPAPDGRSTPRDRPPLTPEQVAANWERIVKIQESGEIVNAVVDRVNRAGAVVRLPGLGLRGFIPYRLFSRARLEELQDRLPDGSWAGAPEEGYTSLVGLKLRAKVTQVSVPEKRIICSEKAALLDGLAATARPGDVIEGRVASLHDFGVFVEVDSGEYAGAEVVLPLREISWDWVPSPASVLRRGQAIRCKVTQAVTDPKAKVVLSLKRMQDDPLSETLDGLMPLAGEDGFSSSSVAAIPTVVPSGVEDILTELSKEPAVSAVALGRQRAERRTVSQDLELWMTRETVEDGFNLVARAGRVLQEIHVTTDVGADEMKAAVQRVLKRVS
jgi:predicted RNA-binding protein with RPS1 domain